MLSGSHSPGRHHSQITKALGPVSRNRRFDFKYDIDESRFAEMNEIVALGRALSDPTRVRILAALLKHELCVCELTDALEVSQSTLSTHLQNLRSAGVVVTTKRQSWIIYSLEASARPMVEAVFEHYPPTADRFQRDEERLARRVGLRVDGCCVLGVGQLDKELVGGKSR